MPELSDIAIELACIGIDVLICGVFYKSISAYKNTIDEIKVSQLANLRFSLFFSFYFYKIFLYFHKIFLYFQFFRMRQP